MLCVLSCCHVRLFVTPWTVAHQAPLSLGMAPGQNAGMGCHALLQGIFPTQGSKPGLPHCRWILYHLSHQGSPKGRYEKCESESHSVMSNSLQPRGLYSPWNSPGWNTGVGSLSLLQQIFPSQELNRGLLYCRWILYQLSYQGSPIIIIRSVQPNCSFGQ